MAKETPNYGFSPAYPEALKELWGYQWKTSQAMMDHGLKFAQGLTDYYHTTMTEGMKIAQDAYKHAVTLSEETRKGYTDFAEKTFKVS